MRTVGSVVCALLTLGGCQPSLEPVDSDDTGSCRVEDSANGWRCSPATPRLPLRNSVDILFVVDNSDSMAEEQGRLAASIDALIEPLEAEGIDYRVGVTTTDVWSTQCGLDSTPEGGAFVFGSCRGRAEQFVSVAGDPPLPFDVACADHCDLEPDQLDALMKPTTAFLDAEERVRPWVQSGPTFTNLPDGVSGVDALRCLLPQGTDGCGFESQLESTHQAVARTSNAGNESYGFIRDDAALAIVILTDEADCSHEATWGEIFSPDGNKVFWSDPDADSPTSAVCWNAGVECVGGPGSYEECHAVNKDVDGALTEDADTTVLRPLERYADLLEGLYVRKLMHQPDQAAFSFSVIAGVPEDYVPGELQDLYTDADDPAFQSEFGIGPGCTNVDGTTVAVPPVRLREIEESFGGPHLYSVCADTYAPALADLAGTIRSQMHPACFPECADDTDPDRAGLQPLCFVEEWGVATPSSEVPPCVVENGDPVVPPGADACHVVIADPTALSGQCADLGSNLEFEIVRRPGVQVPDGLTTTATCQLSEDPAQDCPELGS